MKGTWQNGNIAFLQTLCETRWQILLRTNEREKKKNKEKKKSTKEETKTRKRKNECVTILSETIPRSTTVPPACNERRKRRIEICKKEKRRGKEYRAIRPIGWPLRAWGGCCHESYHLADSDSSSHCIRLSEEIKQKGSKSWAEQKECKEKRTTQFISSAENSDTNGGVHLHRGDAHTGQETNFCVSQNLTLFKQLRNTEQIKPTKWAK